MFFHHQVSAVQSSLESDMELLCLTGVEDKLQVSHPAVFVVFISYSCVSGTPDLVLSVRDVLVCLSSSFKADVRPTLELLRNAGIKVMVGKVSEFL